MNLEAQQIQMEGLSFYDSAKSVLSYCASNPGKCYDNAVTAVKTAKAIYEAAKGVVTEVKKATDAWNKAKTEFNADMHAAAGAGLMQLSGIY